MDPPTYIAGILCDLTKAFDCVNHELPISTLKFYGVRGVILELLKSCCITGNEELTWNL